MISATATDASRYISGLPAPVAAKRLEKELSRFGCSTADALQQGLIIAWPRYRGTVRFWHTHPDTFARQRMIVIAQRIAMKRPELVMAASREAHNCGRTVAGNVLKALISEGILKEARIGTLRLCYAAAYPESLIRPAIEPVLSNLQRLGVRDSAIHETFNEIQPAKSQPEQRTTAISDAIYQAATRLQPAPGVPVLMRDLRSAVEAEKTEFDAGVLSLADAQKVYLTTHDHGWALPEIERQHLVWDGGQKLYVALTVRE